MRPFSPSSLSSASVASSASTRICKKQFIESSSSSSVAGLRSTLYLKLSLPPASTRDEAAEHPLLSLTPLSHILHYATYPLPLHHSLQSSSTDALLAAGYLGIPLWDNKRDSETVGRAEGRRSSAEGVLNRNGTTAAPELKLVWDGDGLVRVQVQGGNQEDDDEEEESGSEWIVVIRLETSFGSLQWPSFANTIFLPLPPCLLNNISITLPSSGSWDIAARPAIRPTSTSSSSATITGSFLSTPLLVLRWIPQASSNSSNLLSSPSPLLLLEPISKLLVENGELEVLWTLDGRGGARAKITLKGSIVGYNGLREKAPLEVGLEGLPPEASWEVESAEGEGVEGWKVLRDDDEGVKSETGRSIGHRRTRTISTSSTRSRRSLSSSVSQTSLRSLLSPKLPTPSPPPPPESTPDVETTPTPRPRLRHRHLNSTGSAITESRPPSFTSIFDATLPVLPPLDSELAKKLLTKPSLMAVAAPFSSKGASSNGDVSGSGEADNSFLNGPEMSFEVDHDRSSIHDQSPISTSHSAFPSPTNSISKDTSSFNTRLSLSLSLSTLLSPSRPSALSKSFTISINLRFASLSSSDPSTRYTLPTFTLPTASNLSSVISVLSQVPGSRVELLGSQLGLKANDSPLPGVGGRARWRTERSSSGEEPAAGIEESAGAVEVEIVDTARNRSVSRGRTESGKMSELVLDGELEKENEKNLVAESHEMVRGDTERGSKQSLSNPIAFFDSVSNGYEEDSSITPITPTAVVVPLLVINISVFPPSSPQSTLWKLFGKVTFPSSVSQLVHIDSKLGIESFASDSSGREVVPSGSRDGSVSGLTSLKTRVSEVVWKYRWEGEGVVKFEEMVPDFFGREEGEREDVKIAELRVVVGEIAGYQVQQNDLFDTLSSVDNNSTTLTQFLTTGDQLPRLTFFVVPVPFVAVEELLEEVTASNVSIADPPVESDPLRSSTPERALSEPELGHLHPEEKEEFLLQELEVRLGNEFGALASKREEDPLLLSSIVASEKTVVEEKGGGSRFLEALFKILLVLVVIGVVVMEVGRLGRGGETYEMQGWNIEESGAPEADAVLPTTVTLTLTTTAVETLQASSTTVTINKITTTATTTTLTKTQTQTKTISETIPFPTALLPTETITITSISIIPTASTSIQIPTGLEKREATDYFEVLVSFARSVGLTGRELFEEFWTWVKFW